MFESVLELYVNRKTYNGFISIFIKTKVANLDGWFSHGKLYRFDKNELIEFCWDYFYKILCDKQDEYGSGKSELDMMKSSQVTQCKLIGISLIGDKLTISPHKKMDKYRGSESIYEIDMHIPINNDEFVEILKKVIDDAE